ncbi:hypothetical protein SAMN05444162_0205 [Paenibacillaceae bacterium GAS479]|nr:hypothetical protein SAMN05444162_0205 [Paenibacillaceae bacterium GAS479]
MKLGSLIVGGVAGAAMALYVARKRPGMAAAASVAVSQLWSGAVRKSLSGMIKKNISGDRSSVHEHDSRSTAAPRQETGNSGASDAQAWAQIAALVSSDPAAKKETEKIMSEAGASPPLH